MIARLTGRIDAVEPDAVVVDVGGVGLRVHVPAGVLAAAAVGDDLSLHTHLHVREAELALYGAPDAATLQLFLLVQTVSGIGPRVALAMLSTFDAATLEAAIAAEDVDALVGVPGVGRKIAQRLVLELKAKVGGLAPAAPGSGGGAGFAIAGPQADAVAALTALGYTAAEAQAVAGFVARGGRARFAPEQFVE